MLAIYKKELRSYFTSMVGYVFIAFFLVIIGIGVLLLNLGRQYANFEYTLSSINFLFVLLTPLLTMRLMAEENKQKTDQLLLTSPLSASAIVVGKLLAVFTVFLAAMGVTCFYPLILSKYGDVNFPSAYASILGFIALGAAYLAIGLFISSLTESQVVAAVISFVIFLFTFLMQDLATMIPSDNRTAVMVFAVVILLIAVILYRMMNNMTIAVSIGLLLEIGLFLVYMLKPTLLDGSVSNVVGWLSVVTRYQQFSYGIFDVTGIIYYISIAFLFAFLTTQVIRKKRWS
jgi:ABC-type Na+ efflux pump, permease component